MSCFEQTTIIIALVFSGLIAIGTISLAFFAFNEIRKIGRDYKRRQLNEILEWAKTAREWDFTKEDRNRMKSIDHDDFKEQWTETFLIISAHKEILLGILRTGYIMSKVALGFNRKSFDEKINCLMTELLKTLTSLGLLRGQIVFSAVQTPPGFQRALVELGKQHIRLCQAAEDVVTEVGELIPTS